jgi:uroporphyrinogen-III decarboxylase
MRSISIQKTTSKSSGLFPRIPFNPVQCSAAQMDARALKDRFGRQLTFWGGGVDTQRTLPFGAAKEVRNEVRDRIRVFAPEGGFVFNTIHNVQVGVPVENLLALYEAVSDFGRY